MHEIGITQEIVALAVEHAREGAVRRIVVEIGRLTAVLPDAVRFCFDICAEGTPAEGAELEIVEIMGYARCQSCGAEQELDQPFGLCACGNTSFDWLAGEELRLRSVEVR